MKAVIVDLDGRRAAALCEDGSVREVENLDYCLGQTITIEEVTEAEEDEPVTEKSKIINYKKWYKKLASAAAVVLILTGIGGASVYAMPYGEVSLDAGSSVVYTINRFDYVLSAEAAAEEGARIIAEVGKENLVNRKIENAVETTLDQIQKDEGSEPDLVYQIRIDIGGNKGGANEAHTEKLQKKLKKVLSDKAPTVEAPEEIKEFLKDVMDEVGIIYEFKESPGFRADKTGIDFNHEVPSKLLETRILGIGPDFPEVIERLPYHEDDTDIQALMMLISLNDPGCPELYQYLRSHGFIFAGSVPGGEEDLIVMEHLKHPIYKDFIKIQPDYEAIMSKVLKINGLE